MAALPGGSATVHDLRRRLFSYQMAKMRIAEGVVVVIEGVVEIFHAVAQSEPIFPCFKTNLPGHPAAGDCRARCGENGGPLQDIAVLYELTVAPGIECSQQRCDKHKSHQASEAELAVAGKQHIPQTNEHGCRSHIDGALGGTDLVQAL